MSDHEPESRIGQQIRSCHRYAYKSGQWATIVGITEICVHENERRGCYQLEWPDGATDDWAIEDPAASYEFRALPMAEYTPSTNIVRALFKIGRVTRKSGVGGQQMDAEFDRWLEAVRAEAQAKALEDASNASYGLRVYPNSTVADWLQHRANKIREGK